MKKDIYKKAIQVMASISFTAAKGTASATTRFYSYQPKGDYEIFRLLQELEKNEKP